MSPQSQSPSSEARSLCESFQNTVAARPDATALRTPGGGE